MQNNDILNVAIIGHGFVGKAVHHGFTNNLTNIRIIDPIDGDKIETLKDQDIDLTFVCVPTPMSEDGKIDSSIVEGVFSYFEDNEIPGLVVLKSTVVPDIVGEFAEMLPGQFIYNPEFLVEANALDDFVNPKMHVFGGDSDVNLDLLESYYNNYSNCVEAPVYKMKPEDASFVKYGINSFLATKVLWFNQFHQLIEVYGSDYQNIITGMCADERIGNSHTKVPGPDGRRGFGSACFSKDLPAIHNFAKPFGGLDILGDVIYQNNNIRKQYELNTREIMQKINFNYNPHK